MIQWIMLSGTLHKAQLLGPADTADILMKLYHIQHAVVERGLDRIVKRMVAPIEFAKTTLDAGTSLNAMWRTIEDNDLMVLTKRRVSHIIWLSLIIF